MSNVLVAYATAKGSTAEVAEELAKVLREKSHTATVADVRSIESLQGYDTLLLGSPIHAGNWLPEISEFYKRFSGEMAVIPTYLWLTCIRVLEQFGEEHVRDYYLNFNILSRMNIRGRIAFAGKLNLERVDWAERWTLAVRYDGSAWLNSLDGDYRDWEKIRAWGEKVAQELSENPA